MEGHVRDIKILFHHLTVYLFIEDLVLRDPKMQICYCQQALERDTMPRLLLTTR